LVRSRVFFIT